MQTLSEILKRATQEHWAVGHFNVSNSDQLQAVMRAAVAKKTYVIIGVSEGERKHLGLRQAVALIRSYEKDFGIPMFANADHSKSFESAKHAVDAGFNSIHIDASEYPYKENVRITRSVVEYVKKISPEISVEGELGFVPGESKVEANEAVVKISDYTDPLLVLDFCKETGIDRLAIFVGNVHGLHTAEPNLDVNRIRDIRDVLAKNIALTLHAGSGILDEPLKKAIMAGIANVHINTDLRVAFTNTLRSSLNTHIEETTPYKLMKEPIEAMQAVVEKKITLFGSENRL